MRFAAKSAGVRDTAEAASDPRNRGEVVCPLQPLPRESVRLLRGIIPLQPKRKAGLELVKVSLFIVRANADKSPTKIGLVD